MFSESASIESRLKEVLFRKPFMPEAFDASCKCKGKVCDGYSHCIEGKAAKHCPVVIEQNKTAALQRGDS